MAEAFAENASAHYPALHTCAEEIDLSACGIPHGCCVDGRLIERLTGRTSSAKTRISARCVCLERADQQGDSTHGMGAVSDRFSLPDKRYEPENAVRTRLYGQKATTLISYQNQRCPVEDNVYYRTKKGKLVIQEDEAAVIRRIFQMFLAGDSCYIIGKKLEAEGVRSNAGTAWAYLTISLISGDSSAQYRQHITIHLFP